MTSPARAEALESACDLAPWDAHYASELGRTLLTQAFSAADPESAWRNLARARAAYERVVRIAPESAEDRALLARVLAAQAALRPGSVSIDQVRAEFQGALAADSTSANVLELVTQGYLQTGLYAEGRGAAIRCATLYPDFGLPMADLGMIALAEDRYTAAADTLALAVQRNWHGELNGLAAARSNLAAAYMSLGRYSDAWQESNRALYLNPSLQSAARIREAAALTFRPKAK
jgi:tetratricopeptide (TPR) repeat protein